MTDYSYRVVCVNVSESPITDLLVLDSSGEFRYGGGYLGLRGYSAHAGPMETSPSDTFTLTWIDDAGQKQSQRLDSRSLVTSSFQGELVFIYGSSGRFTLEAHPLRGYPIPDQRPNQPPQTTTGSFAPDRV